jgi:hypothetical protein
MKRVSIQKGAWTDAKPGDPVVRWLGGEIAMNLKITEVTDKRVVCGAWEFDRETGAEIDDDLGWGTGMSGSYITRAGA